MEGKWLFIWQINAIEGGDPIVIAAKALNNGYTGVCVKIIDGKSPINQDKLTALINACQFYGVKVAFWGYTYGVSVAYATQEAQATAAILIQYKASHGIVDYLIDAEVEYKATGSQAWAAAYMNTLRPATPGIALGLCSFRFPVLHKEFPWLTFLDKCDFHAPQVYWEGSNNPASQLQQSYDELIALKPLPVYPVGSAYCNGGWCATPAQVIAFADKAKEMGLPGINFWAWHSAVGIPGMWAALAGIEYQPGQPPPPPPPPPPTPETPVLLKAHVKTDSTPWVNIRKTPTASATILGKVSPGNNVWVTKIYPPANGAQWVGVIYPGGAVDTDDLAGFMAFTWQDKDLLAWGWA